MDVARYGKDRTAVGEWRPDAGGAGPFRILDSWVHRDTTESKDRLLALYRAADPRPSVINVDVVGLGAGVVDAGRHDTWEEMDALQQAQEARLPIHAVNSGEAATKPALYRNLRAEMGWNVRNLALNGKLSIPAEQAQIKTDLGGYRYEIAGDRVIALELKDRMRERLGRSPDFGDTLMLACGVTARRALPDLMLTGVTQENKYAAI
jgi:hypothetical protein